MLKHRVIHRIGAAEIGIALIVLFQPLFDVPRPVPSRVNDPGPLGSPACEVLRALGSDAKKRGDLGVGATKSEQTEYVHLAGGKKLRGAAPGHGVCRISDQLTREPRQMLLALLLVAGLLDARLSSEVATRHVDRGKRDPKVSLYFRVSVSV